MLPRHPIIKTRGKKRIEEHIWRQFSVGIVKVKEEFLFP